MDYRAVGWCHSKMKCKPAPCVFRKELFPSDRCLKDGNENISRSRCQSYSIPLDLKRIYVIFKALPCNPTLLSCFNRVKYQEDDLFNLLKKTDRCREALRGQIHFHYFQIEDRLTCRNQETRFHYFFLSSSLSYNSVHPFPILLPDKTHA